MTNPKHCNCFLCVAAITFLCFKLGNSSPTSPAHLTKDCGPTLPSSAPGHGKGLRVFSGAAVLKLNVGIPLCEVASNPARKVCEVASDSLVSCLWTWHICSIDVRHCSSQMELEYTRLSAFLWLSSMGVYGSLTLKPTIVFGTALKT